MTTSPGFSSRSTADTIQQLPQRDEAAMTATQPEIGFSNSAPAAHAPDDVHPDVQVPDELGPGFTNDKAITGAESKVVTPAGTEDKSVTKAPAKKTAARKQA